MHLANQILTHLSRHRLVSLAQDAPTRRWRIALYSHDTMGLGHKRRNLLIAQTLATSGLQADILLISGMRDANDLPTPFGVDSLTLPALRKQVDGQYQARHMGLALNDIIALRSQIILTAIKSFQPDLFIVDNVPRGAVRELDATLNYVRRSSTRCVLGLRDVLDTPAAVQRDWQRADNISAIRRYYDAVWIYGDPDLYDLRQEYGFPHDVVAKMRPLGYLDQRDRLNYVKPAVHKTLEALALPDDLVLCLVGGGQDGAALAEAFAQTTFPVGKTGVLLTGPFMPAAVQQRLYAWAEKNPQLKIVDYFEEPTLLLEQASRVIAMGGYNTTCEILSFHKPALLVPRIAPRREQWIRAERLQQRRLLDVLSPESVSAKALTEWLHQSVQVATTPLNLQGTTNLLTALQDLLMAIPATVPQAS